MALCSEIPQDVQESNSRPRDFWQFGERPLLGTEEHVRFDHRVPQLQHSMRHGHRSRSDGAIPSREGAQRLTTRFHRGRPQGRACPAWFCQHVGCLRVAGYVFSQPQSSDPFFCKPRLDFTYTHMYTGMYIYVHLCMCIRMKKRCMRMHIQMNITTATRPYILILFEYLFIYPLVYSWYNSRSLLPLHYVSFRSLLPLCVDATCVQACSRAGVAFLALSAVAVDRFIFSPRAHSAGKSSRGNEAPSPAARRHPGPRVLNSTNARGVDPALVDVVQKSDCGPLPGAYFCVKHAPKHSVHYSQVCRQLY